MSEDMWRRAHRASVKTILTGLLFLVTSCAGPGPPLLSPLQPNQSYGYADRDLGNDRYSLTYLGPPRLTTTAPAEREKDAQAARNQAFDFALWHAAQIAQAKGFEGFRVTDKQTDVDSFAEPSYYDSPFASPYGGSYGAFGFGRGSAVGLGYGYGYGYPGYPGYAVPNPYAHLQARATIGIELLHKPTPGDYSANDVMAQLQRTYPTATAPYEG